MGFFLFPFKIRAGKRDGRGVTLHEVGLNVRCGGLRAVEVLAACHPAGPDRRPRRRRRHRADGARDGHRDRQRRAARRHQVGGWDLRELSGVPGGSGAALPVVQDQWLLFVSFPPTPFS